MPEQEPGFEHIWWRFSDYEVFEVPVNRTLPPSAKDYFRYIVPKPAARLEKYKPILELEHHRSDAVETVLTIDELQDFDIEDESAILAWCKKFGLFGILPHTAASINLAPRWQPPPGQQEEVHIRESKTGSMVTEKQKQMINRIDREREARHQERMAEARAERNQTNYACESAQSDLDYYQDTRDDIGSAGYSAGDMRYVKDKIADARRRIQQNCR